MKKAYTYINLLLIVLLASCGVSKDFAQDYAPESSGITYQQFYDDLSPYGNWVSYQDYGYVWVPYEAGFRPYYNNGHWIYTNYGWTWVSGYNWGWAPFHYGRWFYDNSYGWMWAPGYEWAPAWVSWRGGGDYYGWAPLGPGMDFNINIGSRLPYNYWSFVPHRYINSPRINNYYINRERNVTIINNTTIINNSNFTKDRRVFATGPSVTEVEKNTREKIRAARIVQKNRPGNTDVSGSTVAIYKPDVKERPSQNDQVKPRKIENLNDVKMRRESVDAQKNGVVTKPVTPSENSTPPVNRKLNTNPVLKERLDAVAEKNNQTQETQRTVPSQKQRLNERQDIIREKNNNIRQNENNQNNNNREPAVINNQPPIRTLRQPPNNNQKPDNITPPVNRPPVKANQENTIQRRDIPQENYRPENKMPVNQTPIIRNPNPVNSQQERKETFQRNRD